MKEIWKNVVGFESIYEVSNLGRVRSKSKFVKTKGNGKRFIGSQIRKPVLVGNYYSIELSCAPKRKAIRVHRIVLTAFLPNPENKPCINHIDFNKLNNNLSNLEWCTSKENVLHNIKNNRSRKPATRKVIHTLTGKVYNSCIEGAKDIGIAYGALSRYIRTSPKPLLKYA